MEIASRHVLVVGATGVLGSAVARRLAAEGARLSLSGRRQQALDELSGELGDAVLSTVAADLVDPAAPQRIVDTAASAAPLAAMVTLAGVVAFGPVTELDDDVLDQLVLVDLLAPVRLARAVAPQLGEGGAIVNVSAVVADQPMAGMAAYSAVKAGLTAFDRALAKELRRQKIRVVDVRPPHTETGLVDRALAGEPPRLPEGLAADDVAARIVRALVGDEKDLPADAF